jgi:hypothetical protein
MSVPEMSGEMPGMSGNDLQFSAGQEDSMTGGRRSRMSRAYKKGKSSSSRRSSRMAYRKRRASMGGKRRRSRKNKRSRKGRK